jgi:hypothetical protein
MWQRQNDREKRLEEARVNGVQTLGIEQRQQVERTNQRFADQQQRARDVAAGRRRLPTNFDVPSTPPRTVPATRGVTFIIEIPAIKASNTYLAVESPRTP